MNRRDVLRLSLAAVGLPRLRGQGEGGPAEWRGMYGLLEKEAGSILANAEKEMESRTVWETFRDQRRTEMQQMLGLHPWPERTPLRVREGGRLDREDYTIEKVAFESFPGFFVSTNLYLPRGKGPFPVIVYVCGHAVVPQGAKTYYQRHGISFARNGYACLILDPIQIAEPFSIHHGVYGLELYNWYARGYTPAGIEVWNAMRGMDYLATRPEINMNRVGMTGRSGGAAMTWFTAAVDDRIKVAAPVMGISTYLTNIRENTQKLHCDCMFPINFHRHEMAHQGALIAPRPLLMAHGKKDSLFPVPGYEKTESLLRQLYSSYGPPERFRNLVVDTGHQDSDFLREQVLRWMDEHLLGVRDRALKMEYQNAPADSLTVFAGRPPAEAVNERGDMLFLPAATLKVPKSRPEWDKRKADLREAIGQILGSVRKPEGGIRTEIRRPQANRDSYPGLLYLVPPGEDAAMTRAFLRMSGAQDAMVQMIVHARDWTERPMTASARRDLIRNAMHVGTSPDAMRVADVLEAFALFRKEAGVGKIMVAGKGSDAGVVLYAALLEPGIDGVVQIAPTESHWQGPMFLSILRYTDLPEAAGMLAPRPLEFFERMPAAYELTSRIYTLMDAASAMREVFRLG